MLLLFSLISIYTLSRVCLDNINARPSVPLSLRPFVDLFVCLTLCVCVCLTLCVCV